MANDDPNTSNPKDNDDEVPFYDTFDEFDFTEEALRNIMADSNPTLLDLTPCTPFPVIETSLAISNSRINNEINGQEQPLNDDSCLFHWNMIEKIYNNLNNDDVPEDIFNNNVGESTRLEVSNRDFGENNRPNFEPGGPSTTRPLLVTPPITEGTIQCDCCNVIQEMDHTNGHEVHTLSIHGTIGFICHAILESRFFANFAESQSFTYHLKYLTMEQVKMFLEYYCYERDSSGFRLERNTNAAFYEAMNAISNYNQSSTLTIQSNNDAPTNLVVPDELLNVPPVPMNMVLPDESLNVRHGPLRIELRDEPTTGLCNEREKRKTPLAAQRERTGKMTLKDISTHFHLPIEEAAKQMNLCPTVLKKICRKGGLHRWPHRKIKSVLKKMSSLKKLLMMAKDELQKSNIEADIERLEREIEKICSDALRNAN